MADSLASPAGPPRTPSLAAAKRRPSTAAMLILAGLALIVAIKLAAPILLPVLTAALVALLLNPMVRGLSRRWLPRWLAALMVMSALGGVVGLAGWLSYEPARELADRSPQLAWQFKRKVEGMMHPLSPAERVEQALNTIETMGKSERERSRTVAVVEHPIGLGERYGGLLGGLAMGVSGIMLIYLLLVFGELLFRRIVTMAPTLADKRNTVSVVREIQSDVTRYVGTVTLVNLGLGAAVALALYGAGLENPLFWGVMAALLNYIPYLGPMLGAVLLVAVGVLQFDSAVEALTPAGIYLFLNMVESQLVTPLVLGRSFSLNPVVILVWLLFWGWLWGVPGLLLAMPLLVCTKIVAARSEMLQPFALMVER
ncbi:AI-2E family transporter [Pseudomarimonas salicorniae]|uniref:AI-2E family transporter n=1 Tax=Pseudomarimonas salicorniae TaxID=2933270 RepID=A0ABT0GFM4_9GAMM|nr:AI-2E family transporter [Lysobacter sp. CAU 1642]MCK7593248.1 AI-2E family transporter [Lysobacter sp. CAU 1642]